MKIKRFILGNLDSNSYLVYEEKEAMLIDVGGENIGEIITFLEENNLQLKKVLLTHGHYDHIAGINKLFYYNKEIEVYIGKEDVVFLKDFNLNLSFLIDQTNFKIIDEIKVIPITKEDVINGFNVIDTPGHTIGSKSFYNEKEKVLFSGDTLFKMSFGRTDFPTGNRNDLKKSLKVLNKLPEEVVVYSGHGMKTLIKSEKNLEKKI
ncbi:MAG: hypothetical protein B6I28_05480 [Fusobacteriia bacterium 4572_132]|nr:MAG: hypothetical protein B6I28_05480 [Fusobacteriia bacterium 4572_132]